MRKVLGLLVIAVLLVSIQTADAATFSAIEDAPVYEAWPNDNYDDYSNSLDAELWTGDFYVTYATRSYLKFDLSSLSSAASATLWLYNGVNTGDSSTWGAATVNSYATDSSWSESTITWGTRPGLGTAGGSTVVGSTLGWYAWDITSLVQSGLGGFFSVALASDGPGHVYYARETSTDYAPYLEVEEIPEPATMMMLGSLATGLFGFAGIRKRFSR